MPASLPRPTSLSTASRETVIARLLGQPRRRAVLEVLLDSPDPLPTSQVSARARVTTSQASDTLRGLAQLGLAERVIRLGERPCWRARRDARRWRR